MRKSLLLLPIPGAIVGVALVALACAGPALQMPTDPDRTAPVVSSRGTVQTDLEESPPAEPAAEPNGQPLETAVVDGPDPAIPVETPGPAIPQEATTRRGIIEHVVEAGQTIGEIADHYGVSVETVLWASGLTDPDRIAIGQRLRILPVSGVLHRLRDGDVLSQLASAYGLDVFSIIDVNGIADPDRLKVGTEIVIPGGRPLSSAPAVKPEARSVQVYEVVPGDALSAIANRFGVTLQTLLRANGLRETDPIQPGQKLTILPTSGLLHVVQAGDTLSGIADRYASSVQEIAAANPAAGDRLQVGDKLVIPAREGWQPPAPPAPSVAPGAEYQVQPGDTVSGLADRFRVSAEAIVRANELRDPFILLVGQRVRLPGVAAALPQPAVPSAAPASGEYEVKPGDTLSGISTALGVPADSLIGLNGLRAPFVILSGQKLKVPAATAARPAPTAAPPARPAAPPAPAPVVAAPAPTARPVPVAAAAPAPVPAPAPAPKPGAKPKSEVVAFALKYLGSPYVWGGTTPQGFDCSGFVMYVYRNTGYAMPRDMWGQLQTGSRVNRPDLQPGDIVFFVNTYKAGLSHNGIYIGGGRFVQAAREGVGVIVSSLSEAYWASRYYGASRPQ